MTLRLSKARLRLLLTAAILGLLFAGGLRMPWAIAAVYMLGSLGLGLLIPKQSVRSRWTFSLSVGLAAMLTLSFVLGSTGVLAGAGAILGGAVLTAGLAALVLHAPALDYTFQPAAPATRLIAAGSAIALVITALTASTAPGIFWDSEFGAFDALSYHLQLPKEWLITGSTLPVEHNVYSFLPGYVEHAAHHLHAAFGLELTTGGTLLPTSPGLLTMQCLHALILIAAAWTAAVACGSLAGDHAPRWIAALLVLATPWAVVTGTLAYNEMAVVLLGFGALVAMEIGCPYRRGITVGIVVGVACGAKPTALFMLAPAIGLLMLARAPRSAWLKLTLMSLLGGALAVSPWLVRNFLVSGNPVFPAMTSVFGSAHWTAEQVQRFASAHVFDGSLLERLALTVLPDTTDPAGARHRGFLHPQWLALFPAALLALTVTARSSATQAALAAGLLLQILAWLFLTHIQSRFLLPCLVAAVPLIALCKGRFAPLAGVVAVAQLGALVVTLTQQRAWPSGALATPAQLAGWNLQPLQQGDIDPVDLGPVGAANRTADPMSRSAIALLGRSIPLYHIEDTLYATTWDEHPFLDLVERFPEDPSIWTDGLRQLGCNRALIDLAELDRLARSGFLDPRWQGGDVARAWLDAEIRRGSVRVLASWPTGQVLVRLEFRP